jgi:hypothetical protein
LLVLRHSFIAIHPSQRHSSSLNNSDINQLSVTDRNSTGESKCATV